MGEPTKGPRRATLHDVAADAGVAVSTVSRYLNGQLTLTPETEARVIASMDALNFSRAARARSPRPRSGLLGLIVPNIGSTYFARMAASVVAAADARDFTVLIGSTAGQPRKQSEFVDLLAAKDVAGIVYAGDTATNGSLAEVIASGLPVVVIDEELVNMPPVDTVVVDDYAGAYQATAHLVALGHRRIALVTGAEELVSVRERRRGFADAMRRAGLDPDDQLILSGSFSEEFGVGALSHLLSATDAPTAVFAASDTIALGILAGARNLGVRIPEDLSVVGFDDTPEASKISPRLSTVRTPLDRMAASALTLLVERIDAPHDGAQRIVTPVALVVGESTAVRTPSDSARVS